MKTILLILLLTLNGSDGKTHDGEIVARGRVTEDGSRVPFTSMDDCQAKADEMIAYAKKDPSEVRSVGALCVEVPIIQIGQDT